MVHRDTKPHNLMLSPDGSVKALDLGAARLVGEKADKLAQFSSVSLRSRFSKSGATAMSRISGISCCLYNYSCLGAALGWVLVLGILSRAHTSADEPPAASNATAPKRLGPTDTRRINELETTMRQLQRSGKFAEADAPAQECLAICERALGQGHWQTVQTRRTVAELRRIASLPQEGRKALASVGEIMDRAIMARSRTDYRDAEDNCRKILDIHRQWLGEDHPEIAQSYNNVAYVLNAQGKYAAAEPLFQKALGICQKALGEENPVTAQSYNNVAASLNARGDYPAAEPLLERALAIKLKLLGETDPGTALSYNNLAANLTAQRQYAAAEPLYQKAMTIYLKTLGENDPSTAFSYNNLASNLKEQGKYAAAEPLAQKALAICLNVLGEDHPDTATSYNKLAVILDAQGKYATAEPLFRKALAIGLKALGEDHPDTAKYYSDLAGNLNLQGKYATAEPLYQTALATRLKMLGEDYPDTATSYNNHAGKLHDQGKYAAAEPLFRKALASWLRLLREDHPDTATSYNNLAGNLDDQGKYVAAEPHFRKALAIRLKGLGEDHPDTATSYNNLAFNLNLQGRYTASEPLYQKALAIRLKVLGEDHRDTARTYINLAGNLNHQGKHAGAEALDEKALAIAVKVLAEDDPDTARSYNSLAVSLYAQSKYATAEPLLRKALAIRLKVLGQDHPDTALSYNNLAYNLDAQSHLDEAVHHWMTAAGIAERTRQARGPSGLERAEGVALSDVLAPLALALARQGQFTQAWTRWESSLARGLLDDFSARKLRPLTREEQHHESDMRGQLQQLDEQIRRLVVKAARNQDEDRRIEELRRWYGEVRGRFVAFENDFDERYRALAGDPATLAEVRNGIPADAALVGWLSIQPLGETYPSTRPHHWTCVVRKSGSPIWIKLAGSGAAGAWTQEDVNRPATLRAMLSDPEKVAWRELAVAMVQHYLEPLSRHLEGVRRLIILPSSALAGIPIEALVAAWPEGRDRFVVSYAPSGSMLAQLHQSRRADDASLQKLLAVGDPAYTLAEPELPLPKPPSQGIAILAVRPHGTADLFGLKPGDVLLEYNGTILKSIADLKVVPAEAGAHPVPVRIWRSGEVRSLEIAAGTLGIQLDPQLPAAVVLARQAADGVLKPLTRGEALEPLPGTRREVEIIGSLFPAGQATILLGAAATERAVQERARSGELKGYRFLHFATHGQSNPNVAMSSALMLAPEPVRSASAPADPTALETDGQIGVDQIVQTWDLDADLVVLSACETGLGKYAGGEGYLGFAQALLVKGARSLVLSHWKVQDIPTTLLITRFYANLLRKREGLPQPLPKSDALHEAKRWLRELSAAEVGIEVKRLGLVPASGLTVAQTEPDKKRSKPDPADATRGTERTAKPAAPASMEAYRPFEHPYYWSSFILIGNPD